MTNFLNIFTNRINIIATIIFMFCMIFMIVVFFIKNKNDNFRKIFFIFLILSFFALIFSISFFNEENKSIPKSYTKKLSPDLIKVEPITLKYWRIVDTEDAFKSIIDKYEIIYPNIDIEYKTFEKDEYEKELITALDENRGPDIFSIPHTWMKEYKDRLEPLPENITMYFHLQEKSLENDSIANAKTIKSITSEELRNNFPRIIYEDLTFKSEDKVDIYGLPLYIDTLAMLYNKKLLEEADITNIASDWVSFQEDVKKLTKTSRGRIIQSGVALGTSKNIERSSDILLLLMMQNGATIMDNESVKFNEKALNTDISLGINALHFYTDFANPAKGTYTWDNSMKDSFEAFSKGEVAIIFGYSSDLEYIKSKKPKFDIGVAKMPQIGGNEEINYSNYMVEVVNKDSERKDVAWNFVQFITKEDNVRFFLERTKKPPALNKLISEQIPNSEIGVFTNQIGTVNSWYKGDDMKLMELAINEMIEEKIKKEKDLDTVIQDTVDKLNTKLE